MEKGAFTIIGSSQLTVKCHYSTVVRGRPIDVILTDVNAYDLLSLGLEAWVILIIVRRMTPLEPLRYSRDPSRGTNQHPSCRAYVNQKQSPPSTTSATSHTVATALPTTTTFPISGNGNRGTSGSNQVASTGGLVRGVTTMAIPRLVLTLIPRLV